MIQAGPGGRYIPPRTKIGAITFTLISIGATVVFVAKPLWLRLALCAIAVGVTGFLLWMPSAPRPVTDALPEDDLDA